MKEELIKFVMERADKEYSDDFPISAISDWINEFFDQYQPERSKREDLINDLEKFKPKSLNPEDGYFPPPWNINDFPEKTLGWLEFQKEMKENPRYYLGCGALNSMET